MSQYPPPHPPQSPYGAYPPPRPPSPDEMLVPARRAGTLMLVLGVLGVVFGLCTAWQAGNFDASQAPTPEMQRQMQQQVETVENQLGVSFHKLMLIAAFIPLAVGAVLGGLGLYVRGGSFGFTIASAILVGLLVLLAGFALLAGVIGGVVGGPVVMVGSACVYGIPLLMLSVLMVWLVQALRGATRLSMARQQQQAQMQVYQQYRQAYLQNPPPEQSPPPPPGTPGGMGYHYPTTPPPAPPPETKEPPDANAPPG